jgi:hypothetical protein
MWPSGSFVNREFCTGAPSVNGGAGSRNQSALRFQPHIASTIAPERDRPDGRAEARGVPLRFIHHRHCRVAVDAPAALRLSSRTATASARGDRPASSLVPIRATLAHQAVRVGRGPRHDGDQRLEGLRPGDASSPPAPSRDPVDEPADRDVGIFRRGGGLRIASGSGHWGGSSGRLRSRSGPAIRPNAPAVKSPPPIIEIRSKAHPSRRG